MKLNPDAINDLTNLISTMKEPLNQCCWNCAWSDHELGMCKKYKAVPPMQVITFGCKDWDLVPF